MTEDEIRAQEAGPELDELVATKIMGWERLPEGLSPTVHGTLYKWRVLETDSQGNVIYVKRTRPPCYSTEISVAWEVIDKMRERGLSFHIKGWIKTSEVEVRFTDWYAEHGGNGKWFYAIAESAPLAICRCALLASAETTSA